MLGRMGFSDRWIRWVTCCVGLGSGSVLVNGSPSLEFSMERGLRQGDLIALFLFLIIAKGLGGLMREACKKNIFSGFRVGGSDMVVSHIQYADDTLFIGEPTWENVLAIKSVLRWFEIISGLKVNFSKSKLAVI